MFFSEDDQFVESDASYELADLMGIGEDRTHRFTGQLEKGENYLPFFPIYLLALSMFVWEVFGDKAERRVKS